MRPWLCVWGEVARAEGCRTAWARNQQKHEPGGFSGGQGETELCRSSWLEHGGKARLLTGNL